VLDGRNEDLAVADLAGLGRLRDGFDDLVDVASACDDLDLHFRQEAHGVFRTPIDFGVALLPAVAFDLGDRHALNANVGQRRTDLFQLERFDDGRFYA